MAPTRRKQDPRSTFDSKRNGDSPSRTKWESPLRVVAAVVTITGGFMLGPALVAAMYGEIGAATGLLFAAATAAAIGGASWWYLRTHKELSTVQAFGAVGLSWVAMAAFGSLPYLLTGSIPSVTDAFFESASGFTATGSSILADPATLTHGVLFWRALTHWIGGMGVIVLAIALLPLLGVGAVTLAKAESPGPVPERITPRFSETAKRVWLIYAGFTLAQVVLLAAGDMNLFESIAHSFATISGGGFSTSAESLGGFSAYSQWVAIIFMIIGGTSFALHYRGLRRPRSYVRNAEFRAFILILALAAAAVAIGIWDGNAELAIRDAVFTVTSVMTTTGFATADFGAWIPSLQMILLILMFVGAMTGSTSGSVKVFRISVLWNSGRAHLRQVPHPRRTVIARSGGVAIDESIIRSTRIFVVLYLLIFMTGTALLGAIATTVDANLDVVSIASAVAASLGNIGPGLGSLGPTFTFAAIPTLGKWLLAAIMIIGRLEIIPILLLASPEFWRRQ
jgi:trk system potassium uptake protein TrkH